MASRLPKTGDQNRDAVHLALRATMQPATVDAEKRTVDMTWTTGAQVKRWDWDLGSFYEELSLEAKSVRLDRLNNGAPFLPNHDGGDVLSVLGVVVPGSARLSDKEGVATIRFPAEGISADADKAFKLVRDGILQNVSVGYRVHKMEKKESSDGKIPTYRVTDWEPYEISCVAMGADDQAGFRSLTRATAQQEHEQMTPEEIAKRDAELKAAEDKRQMELKTAGEAAVKAERERSASIRSLVRKHKLGDEFAEKLVTENIALEAARGQILDKLAEESEKVRIEAPHAAGIVVGEGQREKTMRGAEAALLQRHGMLELVEQMQAKIRAGGVSARVRRVFEGLETDPGEFGAMKPVRIAQEFLERGGKSIRGMSDTRIIEAALTHRAAGEQTTSDFSALLENVMYKQYLGKYETADATWKEFCKVDSVQDFRNANRYRSGTMGPLLSKTESGEFQNIAIPDGLKQVISAQTKGGIFNISREALVNDDMGAVLSTLGEAGDSAGLAIELDVYALLNANGGLGSNFVTAAGTQPFFDASNANVNPTGAALGVDTLEADRVVMAKQKDLNGNYFLNIRPSVLLVPVGLGGEAKVINRMEFDNTSDVFEKPNKVRGLFNKIVDTPRLTSVTRRYLFSEKVAAIVVAFLNGERAPFMEQKLGWRIDGTEIKVRIDYGVQFFDPKGAVTNAGV